MPECKIQPEDFELLDTPPGWETHIKSATEIQFKYQHYYVPVEANPHAWAPMFSHGDNPDQKPTIIVHKNNNNEYMLPDASISGTDIAEATDNHDRLFTQIQDACRYQQQKHQHTRMAVLKHGETFPHTLYQKLKNEYNTYHAMLKAIAKDPTGIDGIGPKRAAYILEKQKTGLPSFADSVCMVSCPNCTFSWWQFMPKQYSLRTLTDYPLLHCPSCNHDSFTPQATAPRTIKLSAFEPQTEVTEPRTIAPYTKPLKHQH